MAQIERDRARKPLIEGHAVGGWKFNPDTRQIDFIVKVFGGERDHTISLSLTETFQVMASWMEKIAQLQKREQEQKK